MNERLRLGRYGTVSCPWRNWIGFPQVGALDDGLMHHLLLLLACLWAAAFFWASTCLTTNQRRRWRIMASVLFWIQGKLGDNNVATHSLTVGLVEPSKMAVVESGGVSECSIYGAQVQGGDTAGPGVK